MKPVTSSANAKDVKRKMLRFLFTLSFLTAIFLPTALLYTQSDRRFTYTQYHMGVRARIVVYAPNQASAESACTAAFARIAALDSIMSDYQRDSELNRLAADSGGPPKRISVDLYTVLQHARVISRKSGGAFDVTVGPLVALWRAARKTGELPSRASIQKARKLVGWRKLTLDPRTRSARLAVQGMKLDLGGIAKGYAADCAQRILKQLGISRALVEMGGDIVVSGAPPDRKGWSVRVPNAGRDLEFVHSAISTSGDTEQFVVIGGRRYSHVVDPRTGWALTNRVQATVVAGRGLDSDPLSTTMTVIGPVAGRNLLQTFPGTRLYIRSAPLK